MSCSRPYLSHIYTLGVILSQLCGRIKIYTFCRLEDMALYRQADLQPLGNTRCAAGEWRPEAAEQPSS